MEEQKKNIDNITENSVGTDVQEDPVTATATQEESKTFCAKCGTELFDGQVFCPKCGLKAGEKISQPEVKKAGNKKFIGIIIACVVVVALIAVILLVRGVQAKEITLNKETLTIKAGESDELTYTIDPDDTKDKTVTWKSSNESIAVVSDGKITAKNEGDCTVTVTTKNGKTDTCKIIVEAAGPDLTSIYNECCDSSYASVASDGSFLSIDTNPDDSSFNTYESEAILAIYAVNEALELPDSVITQMGQTRALDGMQSYKAEGIEVNWRYHPDSGMEVIYFLSE